MLIANLRSSWPVFLGSLFPGDLRRALGDCGGLVVVGGVREMKVVWLGRAPGEDGDLVVGVLDGLPVGFSEDERASLHLLLSRIG
jgi:hypothetical protein